MPQADNVFQLEPDDEPRRPPEPAPHQASAAVGVLMLALKTLAQRTLVAFTRLFTLVTVGAAFWLWLSIPDPNTHQLISLGMYSAFTLIVNWLALTRR